MRIRRTLTITLVATLAACLPLVASDAAAQVVVEPGLTHVFTTEGTGGNSDCTEEPDPASLCQHSFDIDRRELFTHTEASVVRTAPRRAHAQFTYLFRIPGDPVSTARGTINVAASWVLNQRVGAVGSSSPSTEASLGVAIFRDVGGNVTRVSGGSLFSEALAQQQDVTASIDLDRYFSDSSNVLAIPVVLRKDADYTIRVRLESRSDGAAKSTARAVMESVVIALEPDFDVQALTQGQTDILARQIELREGQTALGRRQGAILRRQARMLMDLGELGSAFDSHSVLALQLAIEANLATSGKGGVIGALQRPEDAEGFLELVRGIVTMTIAETQAAGEPVNQAEKFLERGDEKLADEAFKDAYKEYRKAYQEAVKGGSDDDSDSDSDDWDSDSDSKRGRVGLRRNSKAGLR